MSLSWFTISTRVANAVFQLRLPVQNSDAVSPPARTDRINILLLNDSIGAVVSVMDMGNVDSAFVAGKVLKCHGKLVNVDIARIRTMVEESRGYIVNADGFTMPLI